ncbi:MAG: hypothetical protein H7224_05085 [Polaromonas sp.]|nr:hypothetical protein [Polaromonas sp.]
MRLLLFILMLTLLPLRGWMGDAMATGMAVAELRAAASPKSTIHSIATSPGKSGPSIGFDEKNLSKVDVSAASVLSSTPDCAGHTVADNMATDDDGHCTPCAACGACHSASMSTTDPQWASAVHGTAPKASQADAFFSADAALRQKPPIS